MIFPRQLCALLRLGVGGIGHDAVELHDALACGIQDTHRIVHAVALDRAAAGVAYEQAAQILLHAALAEKYTLVLFSKIKLFMFRYLLLVFKLCRPFFHLLLRTGYAAATNGKCLIGQHGCIWRQLRNAV